MSANWPDDKHIICTINNDIIPSHPYVLVNKSVLCNCNINAENNFLLEHLATCHDTDTNLVMYFTVNTAFINYIEQFNLTEKLTFQSELTKPHQNTPSQYFLMIQVLTRLCQQLLRH